jgi:hypothetical protein
MTAMARRATLALGGVLGLIALAAPSAVGASTPSLARVVIPDLGYGYTVISQGPLQAKGVGASSPDPAGAAAALSRLSRAGSIATYQRVWQDSGDNNEVQDLVVRFSTVAGARRYLTSVTHTLAGAEVVSSGPLAGIPGAFRATYFAQTSTQVGVGQAIAMARGAYVATISYFSSNAAANTQPITLTNAQIAATAQYASMPPATQARSATPTTAHKNQVLGWLALVIGIIALGDLVLIAVRAQQRRRHARGSWIG